MMSRTDERFQCNHKETPIASPSSLTTRLPISPNRKTGAREAPFPALPKEPPKVQRLLRQLASQSHFEERYEMRTVLASGGMGKIYRAFDRVLRRDIAVKMMHDSSEDAVITPAVQGQFLKEARVGGRLLHPNILPVFDLGVNNLGQTYYTMRLVEGASLQSCLDSVEKGVITKLINFPLRTTIESLVGACQGVDYANKNGVLHLDLKPQNILVSGFSEVFVIDWGLARVDNIDDSTMLADLYRSDNPLQSASSTGLFGHVIGTPGYMAPEQAEGRLHMLNEATDVFGLGGILYFILYGKPPNNGVRVTEILRASALPKPKAVLRPGILPSGKRVPREIQIAIEQLEAICLKALEPTMSQRYPCAEDLVVELNEWLSATPGLPVGF